MSLYVVERERAAREAERWLSEFLPRSLARQVYCVPLTLPMVVDPNARDGEWPAVIALPHETVERDGLAVPLFEGDVERREWQRRNPHRYRRSRWRMSRGVSMFRPGLRRLLYMPECFRDLERRS